MEATDKRMNEWYNVDVRMLFVIQMQVKLLISSFKWSEIGPSC